MDNHFYEYEVTIFNEFSEKEEKVHGVVYGKNLSEAIDKLDKYYGEELLKLSLSPTVEDACYEFEWNLKEEPSGFFEDIIFLNKNLLK